jgi:hypothetical protein
VFIPLGIGGTYTNQYWNASYPSSILSQNTEFPKTYRQVGFQNILGINSSQVNEVLPESDELLSYR